MGTALIVLGALCITAAMHPFLTYPLSLVLVRRSRRKRISRLRSATGAPDGVSICVCAYNEERVIDAKIANLLALKQSLPSVEVLVYVDAASDRTAELLEPYRDRFRLVVGTTRMGKSHGMNLLVSMATQPLLMFTDANVIVDPEAPRKLARYFSDPTVGCVCGHLEYTNAGASVTASSGSMYWRLEEWIKELESEAGSAMGADGSLFAIRRSLHRPPPPHIIDDMFVSLSILCDGFRLVQARDVKAYEESVVRSEEEFRRKVRIACQAFNVHRMLWPRLRRLPAFELYEYLSHKWLRWMTIYFLLAGALLVTLGLFAMGHAVAAYVLLTLAASCAIAGRLSLLRPLAQLWDVFTAFAGTGLGVLQSLRGANFQTWTPASSIRE